MKLKLLMLTPVFFFLFINIVKADGCGIICPKTSHGLTEFFIRLICNFGTWAFCHVASLIAMIILISAVWLYLYRAGKEKRKTIFLVCKILFVILLLCIFYPSIKAFLFNSPFAETAKFCGDGIVTPPENCEADVTCDNFALFPECSPTYRCYCEKAPIINPSCQCTPTCDNRNINPDTGSIFQSMSCNQASYGIRQVLKPNNNEDYYRIITEPTDVQLDIISGGENWLIYFKDEASPTAPPSPTNCDEPCCGVTNCILTVTDGGSYYVGVLQNNSISPPPSYNISFNFSPI